MKLKELTQIQNAMLDALVALGDEDAILERGHFGRDDWDKAKVSLKAARKIIAEIRKPTLEKLAKTRKRRALKA